MLSPYGNEDVTNSTTVQLPDKPGDIQTCGPTQFCTSVTSPNYLNTKFGLKLVYDVPLKEYGNISGNKIEPFNVL
jgi:hypothetical protein